ncbi:MAG: bifunctional methylenetetrahydrofolate dehydrogenase/methenyltetrahydrofolate cyclohydrolase FolD [Thermoguttaceae bacterium]|jgi:methylenetetrahydrofolate dehydrogenase (NADP+)/methenyltetrahydrofolate cyclohydrolase
MTAVILDGKALAEQIRAETAQDAAAFEKATGIKPCLAAVLVGENPASQTYVRNKQKACEKAGMGSVLQALKTETTTAELLTLIDRLNRNPKVHGILVQLPLPKQINEYQVLEAIDPLKDVDALHPQNVGRIVQGRARFLPCTPQGIQQLLIRNNIQIAGANVVVLGRSEIVGKPMAIMLMQRSPTADATVTVCHSRTKNLPEICRTADILIVAIGKAKFLTADMVKPGATVIDVGINRTDAGLVGDVDFQSVKEVAAHITPVPGGIGPLTIAMLLKNTLLAAKLQAQSKGPGTMQQKTGIKAQASAAKKIPYT